jgi:hypothetical protein
MDTYKLGKDELQEFPGGKHINGESKQTSTQTKMGGNKNYIAQNIIIIIIIIII